MQPVEKQIMCKPMSFAGLWISILHRMLCFRHVRTKMADEVLFEFIHMEIVSHIHATAKTDEKVRIYFEFLLHTPIIGSFFCLLLVLLL